MRRSGGLGSVLPVGAVSAAYLDLSPRIAPMTSGTVPSLSCGVERVSFVSCTTYDELGRLRHAWTGAVGCTDSVSAVGSQPGGFNSSWTYTDDGNIATRRDGGTTSTYGYADAAHPHAVTGASGSTFAYTAGGNQRSRTSGSTTTTLTWDVLSRLTTAVTAVGGTTTNTQTYVEAVDGTRLERTVGATTTRYLPGQEIDYTSGVVSGARRYYAIAGTTVAVRVVTPATAAAGGVLTWQVSDRQGSATLQVTDRTGVVARAYTDPYGAPRPSTTALVTDRGWLQKTKDTTGLVDLGARYYDPVLGRFLSPDPLNVQVTAQSANAYAYSNNNPVTYTDPTGLYAVDEDGNAYNGNHQIGHDNRRGTPQQVERALEQMRYEKSVNHHTDDPNPGLMPEVASTTTKEEGSGGILGFLSEVTGIQNVIDCVHGSRFDCFEAGADVLLGVTGGWIVKKAATGALRLVEGVEAVEAAGAVEAAATESSLVRAGETAAESCLNSFTGDTPVLVADGRSKPIRDVVVGDRVIATDPENGTTAEQPVVALIRHGGVHDMVDVTLDDGAVLHSTAGHPIWDATTRAFTDADQLIVGHRIETTGGRTLVIIGLRHRVQDLTAYNLQIGTTHTYYAGSTPVLVHNSCFSPLDAISNPKSLEGLTPSQVDDLARNAGMDVRPGKAGATNPATRYYFPGTNGSEGFRVLPQGVAGQVGIKGGAYLKYFGGELHGTRVPLDTP